MATKKQLGNELLTNPPKTCNIVIVKFELQAKLHQYNQHQSLVQRVPDQTNYNDCNVKNYVEMDWTCVKKVKKMGCCVQIKTFPYNQHQVILLGVS